MFSSLRVLSADLKDAGKYCKSTDRDLLKLGESIADKTESNRACRCLGLLTISSVKGIEGLLGWSIRSLLKV